MAEGYSITTYKMQLARADRTVFQATASQYQAVCNFYYRLLKEPDCPVELGSQALLRHLEKQTIKGRDGVVPPKPLPYDKVPLYFRRAAINSAIAVVKSHSKRLEKWQADPKGNPPVLPESLKPNMVYYKGMYKDINPVKKTLALKLYNGNKWTWETLHFTGRAIPEGAETLSPTFIIKPKYIAMHLPVKTMVTDTRSAKARVQAGETYITVTLPEKDDTLAVCVSDRISPRFIKGGKALAHKRRHFEGKAKKTGDGKWYRKIAAANDNMAHRVSRQIVDYAQQAGAKLIVLPKYKNRPVNPEPYVSIARHIINDVTYKAWQQGITVTFSYPGDCESVCHLCGEPIKTHGSMYACPKGHRGNRALNTAFNRHHAFYKAFYQT